MTATVMVWGKSYQITLHQHSKTVWFATGDYMGQSLQVKGSSSGTATKAWRMAAEYKGK
jgi:hypothetical protein